MFAWLRRRKPEDTERLIAAALEHHQAGRLADAEAGYRAALGVDASQVRARQNLGTICLVLGRTSEAIECLREAIALKPDLLEAHYNLGIAYRELGQREEAARSFREVLRVNPGVAEAHYCLGQLHCDEDRTDEALAAFRDALAVRPQYAEARWALAMAALPQVYAPGQDPARCRAAFEAGLGELERWVEQTPGASADAVGAAQPFSLAYQEENNRALLERYGRLCARALQGFQQKKSSRKAQRKRIGVVSAQFHNHSVWHALVKGWFRELDPQRFELCAFHLGSGSDEETAVARAHSAHFEEGARDWRQWAAAIERQEPDALIYPEIGMHPMALKLASLRLARLQAASWGHPETTGLPTIDCYLSAEDLEPPDAQANYTERLVTLPHLGCCFEPRLAQGALPGPRELGVPDGGPLLVCPGMPHKYAPQHDWVFPEIARRLGDCRFVFFAPLAHALSERMRRRLEAAFAAQGMPAERHLVFLPWLPNSSFQGLMTHADAYLDTIGFSGFNTALQAVQCGLPVVTREGRFLRGRLASGILKRLGMGELVASSEQGYVELVERVARDPGYRESLRGQLKERVPTLYGDRAPVRALEALLADA